MASLPHPDQTGLSVACGVITVSDTRTIETDRSGQLIQHLLQEAGHTTVAYTIIPDDPAQILATFDAWGEAIDVIIINGGTGIAPRDTTYDAIAPRLDKTLPGFGELFRWLSYQEIGSRAMASRAIAGTLAGKLIFSLPGSSAAVTLGMQRLILPELIHLVQQLRGN
jgi:molybdopterin adenylyltransferase